MSSAGEDISQFGISSEEKDKLVGEIVRYVLFKTEQNNGCPIKREELTQIITGKKYKQRHLPNFVINEAKSKLASIFGYDMSELQRSRPSSAAASSQQSDAMSYVIISKLPDDACRRFVENPDTSPMSGFTFVVLGIVHLAGSKISEELDIFSAYSEENLWHHLRRLGLSEMEEIHPVLGNIKQKLEALVQQRYLQKDKVSGPEANTLYYQFAERAQNEAVSCKIKEYISQIVQKDSSPTDADD